MNVAAEALSRFKIRKLVREFRKATGCHYGAGRTVFER